MFALTLQQKSSIDEMQRQLDDVRQGARFKQLEAQIEAQQRSIDEKDAELDALRQNLSAAQNASSTMTPRSIASDGSDAQDRLRQLLLDRQQQLDRVISERIEQDKRIELLEREHTVLENELLTARNRMSQYERGFGISDAMTELRTCQAANNGLQNELAAAYDKLASADRHLQLWVAENRQLRSMAGVPDTWGLREEDVELESMLERQRLKSVVTNQQKIIDRLERERLELLEDLRRGAIHSGERGVLFLGLDSDRTQMVLEYAERLRNGDATLPVSDHTMRLQHELQLAQLEVHRLRSAMQHVDHAYLSAAPTVMAKQPELQALFDELKSLRDTIAAQSLLNSAPFNSESAPTELDRSISMPRRGDDLGKSRLRHSSAVAVGDDIGAGTAMTATTLPTKTAINTHPQDTELDAYISEWMSRFDVSELELSGFLFSPSVLFESDRSKSADSIVSLSASATSQGFAWFQSHDAPLEGSFAAIASESNSSNNNGISARAINVLLRLAVHRLLGTMHRLSCSESRFEQALSDAQRDADAISTLQQRCSALERQVIESGDAALSLEQKLRTEIVTLHEELERIKSSPTESAAGSIDESDPETLRRLLLVARAQLSQSSRHRQLIETSLSQTHQLYRQLSESFISRLDRDAVHQHIDRQLSRQLSQCRLLQRQLRHTVPRRLALECQQLALVYRDLCCKLLSQRSQPLDQLLFQCDQKILSSLYASDPNVRSTEILQVRCAELESESMKLHGELEEQRALCTLASQQTAELLKLHRNSSIPPLSSTDDSSSGALWSQFFHYCQQSDESAAHGKLQLQLIHCHQKLADTQSQLEQVSKRVAIAESQTNHWKSQFEQSQVVLSTVQDEMRERTTRRDTQLLHLRDLVAVAKLPASEYPELMSLAIPSDGDAIASLCQRLIQQDSETAKHQSQIQMYRNEIDEHIKRCSELQAQIGTAEQLVKRSVARSLSPSF